MQKRYLGTIKKIAKEAFQFVIYSHFFVALIAFFLTLQTYTLFKEKLSAFDLGYCIFAFTGTYWLYGLQRFYQLHTLKSNNLTNRLLWFSKNKVMIVILGLVFLGYCKSFIIHEFHTYIFYLLPFLLIAFLYFLPPLKLRKITFFKPFLLAIVWSGVCCFLPYLLNNLHFEIYSDKSYFFYLAAQTAFIIGLSILFDINDLEKDKEEFTKTFAVALGIKQNKIIASLFILIYTLLMGIIFCNSKMILALIITTLLSVTLILFLNKNRKEYYFLIGVDGLLLLQSVLFILFKSLC